MKKTFRLLLLILCFGLLLTAASCSKAASEPTKTQEKDKSGKNVYFAAPLFNQMEREYNLKLVTILENHGYKVFLPQRDGFLAPDLAGLTEEQKLKKIFDKDYTEVLNADIVFVVLDGRAPDEGACVELGIAYANNKRCYGIKNDARSVESDIDINPMITGCLEKLFYNLNYEELIKELEDYLNHNQL